MAVWLFRAGKSGEYETKFLNDGKIYLTWDELNTDLSQLSDREELLDFLLQFYSDAKRNTVRNWLGQIYPFAHRIEKGDWIILSSKLKSAIHIGKVTGDYEYHPEASNPFFIPGKWIGSRRTSHVQDLIKICFIRLEHL